MGVLDDMTKGITDRKAKAAGPKLTPVGAETSPTKPSLERTLPELKGDIFPYDGGIGETAVFAIGHVRESLRNAAQFLGQIEECLQSIERAAGTTVGGEPKRDPMAWSEAHLVQKAREREADELARQVKAVVTPEESFDERFARLSAAAVDSAFPNLDAESDAPADAPGWTCPKHGGGNVNRLTSRKGRAYYACGVPGCAEFERS